MMRNGLRTGSPACTEGRWKTGFYLDSFYNRTTSGDMTGDTTMNVDFIAIHWYDWGNWTSTGNATPTASQILSRLKSEVSACYAKYQKPIWITEFNANPNRDSTIHYAFMQLAMQYLDTCSYVERYAYFLEVMLQQQGQMVH